MTSQQLDEERIFHLARKLSDADAQAEYLDQVCAGDQALRERVEELLRVHEQEQSFLKSSGDPLPTVAMGELNITSGQQIGRYKLLQKIGEGGFGVVFMAEQNRPVRRKVALKVIKPGMDTQAVVARFEAERQALAMMDHPNIARVFDGGATDGGRPYFVMELVKGVPITEYCDKNELSTEQRLKLFTTVCQAVQHAHQKGIIHRDLKPSNVLVTLADGEPVVKVIDFGVAKATNQQLTEKTLFTAFGQMVGTPQYMSPEQAEMSCLDVDTRSDVYSLGVLLYELLTGTTPLEAERLRTAGYAEMQRMIREEEPPKPSTRLSTTGKKLTIIAKHRKVTPEKLKSQVKGDLDWIVMKALEKERNRRYESPLELSRDIDRCLLSESVIARPPTLSYRLSRYVRRNRVALCVATALVGLLAIGFTISTTLLLQKQALLEKYRNEVEMNALDALLAGKPDADDLIDDASAAGSKKATLTWLRAMSDLNRDQRAKAIQKLEKLRDTEFTLPVAAQATLAWAYIEAGELTKNQIEVTSLTGREPVTYADKMMLGVALQWVDDNLAEKLLREVVAERDSPLARTLCARSIAVRSVLTGDPRLAEEASQFISIAEMMTPNLQIVNDTSVFVHHVGMLHSENAVRERHRKLALQAAAFQERDSFGELIRGHFYEFLGNYSKAKESFIAAAETGDMPAYYLAPFLALHHPETAIAEFDSVRFADPQGAGALGGRAVLLALTEGRQKEAIELSERIVHRFQDFDTRLDALCASMLAGNRDAVELAEELLPTCIAPVGDLDKSYKYFVNDLSFEEIEAIANADPKNGHSHYAAGVKFLVAGKRNKARQCFERSASSPNFMSSYPYYSRVILNRMSDPAWPKWLTLQHGDGATP